MPLTLGLNKYTHSAAACLLDARGEILFAQSKERVSRKKHDGGDVAELVRYALERSGRKLSEIGLVVQNNHLFSIEEYEKRLSFTAAMHASPPSELDAHNLLPGATRWELSHHLAHAWSVAAAAPFTEGLILVMDGMGSPREIARPAGKERRFTDGNLPRHTRFREFPATKIEGAWREGETAYWLREGRLQLLWKRWIAERSPSFLYNFGFENMESLGAIYSRISSHIFGDWNQCGKVMGLAAYGNAKRIPPLVSGPLESLRVNWKLLQNLPHVQEWKSGRHRRFYADLAARTQADLERTTLAFLRRLRRQTGAKHLAFTGGVALNSLLNGRIAAESGFESVFIPPYPGDEGVAVGCALFGLHKIHGREFSRRAPSPYLGAAFSQDEMEQAIEEFSPWIETEKPRSVAQAAAETLARHRFVGWFQGRSEFGPRALGNRSILAHPGKKSSWVRLNEVIKKRESFRPFAPVVRQERAAEYFRLAGDSRYMSLTVSANSKARRNLAAVVHVDGSSRAQVLRREENPLFDDLLRAFESKTGLPVLLNTSFNVDKEPIVESPHDAIRSFLESGLDLLVLGSWLIRRRDFPAPKQFVRWVPRAVEGLLVEMRTMADGQASSQQISVQGRVFDANDCELACLALCDSSLPVSRLILRLQKNEGIPASETQKSLRRLFEMRAIRFD